MKSLKKIILIGNSLKFKKIFKSIYKKKKLKIFSWRKLKNINYKKINHYRNPHLLILCGYDFSSSYYCYKKYFDTNVTLPLKLTKYLSGKKTEIIYISTTNNLKKKNKIKNNCYSRYEYAKKYLRYSLLKKYTKIKILDVPAINNFNGDLDIYGGIISNYIFKILNFFKIIKTIDIKDLKKKILEKNSNRIFKYPLPNGIYLNIPRPLIIDRLLRLLFN